MFGCRVDGAFNLIPPSLCHVVYRERKILFQKPRPWLLMDGIALATGYLLWKLYSQRINRESFKFLTSLVMVSLFLESFTLVVYRGKGILTCCHVLIALCSRHR